MKLETFTKLVQSSLAGEKQLKMVENGTKPNPIFSSIDLDIDEKASNTCVAKVHILQGISGSSHGKQRKHKIFKTFSCSGCLGGVHWLEVGLGNGTPRNVLLQNS